MPEHIIPLTTSSIPSIIDYAKWLFNDLHGLIFLIGGTLLGAFIIDYLTDLSIKEK